MDADQSQLSDAARDEENATSHTINVQPADVPNENPTDPDSVSESVVQKSEQLLEVEKQEQSGPDRLIAATNDDESSSSGSSRKRVANEKLPGSPQQKIPKTTEQQEEVSNLIGAVDNDQNVFQGSQMREVIASNDQEEEDENLIGAVDDDQNVYQESQMGEVLVSNDQEEEDDNLIEAVDNDQNVFLGSQIGENVVSNDQEEENENPVETIENVSILCSRSTDQDEANIIVGMQQRVRSLISLTQEIGTVLKSSIDDLLEDEISDHEKNGETIRSLISRSANLEDVRVPQITLNFIKKRIDSARSLRDGMKKINNDTVNSVKSVVNNIKAKLEDIQERFDHSVSNALNGRNCMHSAAQTDITGPVISAGPASTQENQDQEADSQVQQEHMDEAAV